MTARKSISNSFTVNTVEDGTSPSFCDLTNQMGSVACESNGDTISTEQSVATDVNYFLGSTKQTITQIVCTMENGIYTLTDTYGSSGANQYYRRVISNLNTDHPTVTIFVKGGAPLSTPEKVNIQATANSQPMAKDMTINGIKGGADAVIYQLLPQQSEVSVGRDSSNLLTPQYNSVKVGYTKTQGGTTTTVAEATATIDSKYRVYFRRRTRSTGEWESTYYFYGYSTYYAYIVKTSAANSGLDVRTYDAVEFYLYENTSSNTLSSLTTSKIADRETIPVVSDGEDGDTIRTVQVFRAHPKPSAPTASAIPPTDWSLTPPTDVKHFVDNGDYRTAYGNQEDNIFILERVVLDVESSGQTLSVNIVASSELNYDIIGVGLLDTALDEDGFDALDSSRKVSGTNETFVNFNSLTIGTHFIDIAYKKDDGVSQNYDTGSYKLYPSSDCKCTIYPNRIWTSIATFKNGVKQGSWSTPVPFNGEQGEKGEKGDTGARGKTGRFFYYGKEFNTSRTDTFSATDTEAPFFYYNSNYWLYKGENFSNKTITLIQSAYGAPSDDNDNWEIMVSDFKYLITEAIFSSYAHFGGAIINGDWLISQYGTKNGSESQDYMKFDPKYPNESVNTTHTVNGTTWTGYNFVPNYCVDLKKGSSYQYNAVISGTVMAENFSQTLALIWSDIKCWTLTPNGEKRTYIYYHTLCTEDWFLEYQENEGKTFNVGDIILYNPDSDTHGDLLYESNFGISEDPQDEEYFSPYIGEASIIQAVNSISGSTTTPKYDYIVIPSAKHYAGKRLEIRNKGTGSLDVYAYKNPNVAHQFYNYIEDYPIYMSGRVFEKISITASKNAILWSDGTYWVVLEK